jgi:hypothetical protein
MDEAAEETGAGRQEPGVRSQELGEGRQESGDRSQESGVPNHNDLRSVVRAVMQEMGFAERETLERKVNELIAENQRARAAAEAAERSAAIRAELQNLGVAKIDLAYRAVRDDVYRGEDGRLVAQGGLELKKYLEQFVGENPELLPARLSGGSGAVSGIRDAEAGGDVDLSRIRPGMNAEEMDRVRREIARVAARTLRGN